MKIINVSGHNNNCGLYSLALAVSFAINEKNLALQNVPAYIKTIEKRHVDGSNAYSLEEFGKKLRDALAEVLCADENFKKRHFFAFIQLCLNLDNIPQDMQAFYEANKDKITELNDTVNKQISIIDNNLSYPSVSEQDINFGRDELIGLMKKDDFSLWIDDWLASKNVNIDNFLYFCTLFNNIWKKIANDIPHRQETKDKIETWFFIKASEFLDHKTKVGEIDREKLRILSNCRVFMGGNNDIQHNNKEILFHILVKKQWDDIYNNYVEYVKDKPVMLSASELARLANCWGVGLNVYYSEDKQSASQNSDENFELYVSLINESKAHWQVFDVDGMDIEPEVNIVENTSNVAKQNYLVNSSLTGAGEYAASGLKRALHGNIYQLKLLMLFLRRGSSNNYEYTLATEMDAAEKFDDVVFKYSKTEGNKEPKWAYRFLQAKHRYEDSSKISAEDLLTENDEDFSLQKYFMSYVKIKKKFTDGMLEDFTICTNINFDFEGSNTEINLKEALEQIIAADDILNIHGRNIAVRYCFKKEFNDKKKLYSILKNAELNKIVEKFIDVIAKNGKFDLRTPIIQTYQSALLKEKIIDMQVKKINQNFILGINLTSNAKKFRECLFKKLAIKNNIKIGSENYETKIQKLINDSTYTVAESLKESNINY